MILVRDIFQLKFGKAKDAIALWQEGKTIAREIGHGVADRLTTDLTGPYYRMVMESTHESLAAFEKSLGSVFKYRSSSKSDHRIKIKRSSNIP